MHLDTAAVRAAHSSHVPSAVVWVGDPCRVVCDRGHSPATAPVSADHPVAFPAQPGLAAAFALPHAESPPALNIHINMRTQMSIVPDIFEISHGSSDLVKVLAQQGSGLGARQIAEFGHEVHLPLGEHTGRSPQLPLSLTDGLVLVLDGGIQSLDCLVQLEKRSLLLKEQTQSEW